MNESKSSEEALFEAVLQLPAAKRGACLAGACGGGAAVRQRLKLLPRAHDEAGDFMTGLADPTRDADLPRFIGTPAYMIGSEHLADKRCIIVELAHYAF
jgi:hypothetical protein